MKINMLKYGYKNNLEFYEDFLKDELQNYGDKYIDYDEDVEIPHSPDFPIYLARRSEEERKEDFFKLVKTLDETFLNLDRANLLDELFWHSYLCIYKREYILETYPEVKENIRNFENIVIKEFNWENYIYKAVLACQYVNAHIDPEEHKKYYESIMENFDVFNYIIKYEIFRNSNFLINFLKIIEETGTSKTLKSRIYNRDDLGRDERYGRRVVYEFNKSYPIVLSPMLTKDELKEYFIEYLGYYYKDIDSIAS